MNQLKLFLETIKFEHTLFALPFAYLGLVLAEGGWPRLHIFIWVTVAMVSLRTVGMIMNRLLDIRYDQKNPRTSIWPLSQGLISKQFLLCCLISCCGFYFYSVFALNKLCLLLSFIPLFMVCTYPLFKRFTWGTHLYLGSILAISPMGGWIASEGSFSWYPVPLVIAVLFWVAGFDIIYSLQDEGFDRREGLFSLPSRFGKTISLRVSSLFQGITLISLFVLGSMNHLGVYYWVGFVVAGILIFQQQFQVRGHNLSFIPKIFFIPNVCFSLILLVSTFLDLIF